MSCDTIRQQISGCLDDSRPLPNDVRNHVASCRPCREFYEACRRIGERLTADAACECPAASPLLREAVMARCSQAQPGSSPARNWRRIVFRVSAAALATAAMITVALLVRPLLFKPTVQTPRPVPTPIASHTQPPADGSARLVAWLVKNPDIVPQSLNMASQAVEEPVKQQADLLVKKGADFASALAAALPIKSTPQDKP